MLFLCGNTYHTVADMRSAEKKKSFTKEKVFYKALNIYLLGIIALVAGMVIFL